MTVTFSIGSAIFGFLLSFLSAFIGGVGFPDLLIRPLMVAFLFGLIAYGILVLLEKQFPGLIQDFKGSPPSRGENRQEEGVAGEKIDIVVDSDPQENFGPFEDEGVEEIRTGDSFDDPLVNEEKPQEERTLPLDESSEEDQGRNSPRGTPEPDPLEEGGDLPDLGAFEESFQQTVSSSVEDRDLSGNQDEPLSQGRESSTVTFQGEEHDPELMARAVQHALKKDQGGR